MKTDFSQLMYEVCFTLEDRQIEICLKNGTQIQGYLITFQRGDCGEPYIRAWRIQSEPGWLVMGFSEADFCLGTLINQKEIRSLTYTDNQSKQKKTISLL